MTRHPNDPRFITYGFGDLDPTLAADLTKADHHLHELTRAIDRNADLAAVCELADKLAADLDRARAQVLTKYDFDRAIDLAVELHRVRNLALDLGDGNLFALTKHLAADLTHARDFALELAYERELASKAQTVPPAWRPAGRFPVRLTEWAARILPQGDRSHYRELYRSELTELAQGHHPRRAQAAYTLRVLLRALPLRRTLRAPVPRQHPVSHP